MADTMTRQEALFEYLLRLGDDRLVLGHRLSEWCGHGPILEEDLALANIALDHIGHAASLLEYAGDVEGKDRDQDDLAYFREATNYRNLKMVELPKADFAFTTARQFLFSAFSHLHYEKLKESSNDQLKGLASKAYKEIQYHLRHSREWMLRLGDGTDESHKRVQDAVNALWMYTGELFFMDEVDEQLIEAGVAPDLEPLRPEWKKTVKEVLNEATLDVPSDDQYMATGGRTGFHTEHLGYLLAEMQILPRSFPEAEW